jgi:hypothetical protein
VRYDSFLYVYGIKQKKQIALFYIKITTHAYKLMIGGTLLTREIGMI